MAPTPSTGQHRHSPLSPHSALSASPDPRSRLSPAEKRELLYGPGGVFGPTGPFSTPEISRYPEVTQTKRISFADMVDGKSDQSGFAEDRSDKSQYVTNAVISCSPVQQSSESRAESRAEKRAKHPSGKRSSPTVPVSRVDSYLNGVKEANSKNVKTSSASQNQDVTDAWVQEKQKRMLNWINRSQVALGGKIIGKTSS